jgi:hypothetical protein
MAKPKDFDRMGEAEIAALFGVLGGEASAGHPDPALGSRTAGTARLESNL